MTDQALLLDVARRAAIEAGQALVARGEGFQGVAFAQGRDIKLKADKAAENVILPILLEKTDYPVLSEEAGWSAPKSGRYWVVDPLDGSANYNRHIPLCCVSIALVENDKPILGVINHFDSGELYTGVVGVGAELNGLPIKVGDIRDPGQAILMTGLPVYRDFSEEALGAFARDFARWKKVRMIGSAALSIAFVAAGKADRYKEESIMFWDVAAGCAIAEAAGGRAVLSAGPMDGAKTVCVDNGLLP